MQRLLDQYYPGGATAVNAGAVVKRCVDMANCVCGSEIKIKNKAGRAIVKGDVNHIISQMIVALEEMYFAGCMKDIVIASDKEKLYVGIEEDDGGFTPFFELDIYDGVPLSVVSDEDAHLCELVRAAFEKSRLVKEK